MGSVLKIKPIIRVDHADGKYSTVSKSRTIPQALDGILDYLHLTYAEKPVWVNVLHGRFAQAAEEMTTKAKGRLNVARLELNRISPVLGVHTGPGIVGAAVLPFNLLEDLL
jgi:fatty acid-binding protein DegV